MEIKKVALTPAQTSLVIAMLQAFYTEPTSSKAKVCATLMKQLGLEASLECFVGSMIKRFGSAVYADIVLEVLFDQLASRTAIKLTDEEATEAEQDLAGHIKRYVN